MRYFMSTLLLLSVWLLFSGSLSLAVLISGLLVSVVAVFLFRHALSGSWTGDPHIRHSLSDWIRIFIFLLFFIPFFLWKIVSSGFAIALLALTPSVSFWPGIVRIETRLPGLLSPTLLAHCITLTPGTLSLDYIPEADTLFIHWIDVSEYHADTVDDQVTGGIRPFFERMLK
ncbi:Na+/H+ antiporter subunit E [Spirochaeta dissipatitropha]